MDRNTRNSAIAAAIIFVGFAAGAYLMPTIMLRLGEVSTIAAGIVAALFISAFFGIFYFRARARRDDEK